MNYQKKRKLLLTKYYNFFLGEIYLTSNDRSQNCKCLHRLWFRWLAKKLSKKFTLKNCLFGVNNIVKSNNKEKYAYSG